MIDIVLFCAFWYGMYRLGRFVFRKVRNKIRGSR